MNKILQLFNRRTSVSAAAMIISASYLISRLLGLLRDRLLVSNFGISPLTDAYTAAFRLPELLFTLLVSGAFAVAFIPVLAQHLSKGEQEEAWELSSILLNLLAVVTIAVGIIAFIFADPITRLIAPGFDEFRHNLTVDLTRIMLITPFLFAISSVLGGIQQSFNRFMFFALASVFYNLGIIFGIVFLSGDYSIYGVAYGVVIGAALQALLQILGLSGLGYRYRPSFNFRNKNVGKVVRLMIPRSLDQGIDQLHYTVETIIGSRLATGSLTSLYYANNLKNVPLSLIGVSIATAVFPRMAARAAKGSMQKLIRDFVVNARLILFLVIPAATVALLMRGYIVRLLYGFGDATTANVLGWFAGVIIFQSLFFLVARMFYAMQDSKTPLYISIAAIGANIGLSLVLTEKFGVVGLAMAQSVVVTAETLVLLGILKYRLGSIGGRSILQGVFKMLIANAVMAGTIYILVARVLPLYKADVGFGVVGPKFFIILTAGILAYLIPCYILQLKEAKIFVGKIKEQIARPLSLT
ncbi:MAG TPA: murein biosynthesis integral membrane protein MurJ [Candidatus Dormibacteraeota bacterium]|nr:murein biosynthesis integral membrane protein MurJ [Candidatus Dormibacteraeota bacterium]